MTVVGVVKPVTRGGNLVYGREGVERYRRGAVLCSETYSADPIDTYYVVSSGLLVCRAVLSEAVGPEEEAKTHDSWMAEVVANYAPAGLHPRDWPHPRAAELLAWFRTAGPVDADAYNVLSFGRVEPRHLWVMDTLERLHAAARAEDDYAAAERKKYAHLGYVGTIKTRATFNVVVDEIQSLGVQENEFKTEERFLVKMTEVGTGNKLVWWTGENLSLEASRQYEIDATPQKHEEFRYCPVTTVNRVTDRAAPKKERKKKCDS